MKLQDKNIWVYSLFQKETGACAAVHTRYVMDATYVALKGQNVSQPEY